MHKSEQWMQSWAENRQTCLSSEQIMTSVVGLGATTISTTKWPADDAGTADEEIGSTSPNSEMNCKPTCAYPCICNFHGSHVYYRTPHLPVQAGCRSKRWAAGWDSRGKYISGLTVLDLCYDFFNTFVFVSPCMRKCHSFLSVCPTRLPIYRRGICIYLLKHLGKNFSRVYAEKVHFQLA